MVLFLRAPALPVIGVVTDDLFGAVTDDLFGAADGPATLGRVEPTAAGLLPAPGPVAGLLVAAGAAVVPLREAAAVAGERMAGAEVVVVARREAADGAAETAGRTPGPLPAGDLFVAAVEALRARANADAAE